MRNNKPPNGKQHCVLSGIVPLLVLVGCATTSPPSALDCPTPSRPPSLRQPIPSQAYSTSASKNIEGWQKSLTATPAMPIEASDIRW